MNILELNMDQKMEKIKYHITGHSLAGALAQYVYFYAYCKNMKSVIQ